MKPSKEKKNKNKKIKKKKKKRNRKIMKPPEENVDFHIL